MYTNIVHVTAGSRSNQYNTFCRTMCHKQCKNNIEIVLLKMFKQISVVSVTAGLSIASSIFITLLDGNGYTDIITIMYAPTR